MDSSSSARSGSPSVTPSITNYSVAVIGDQPYGDFAEPATDLLLNSIAEDSTLGYILHTGDIKGGGEQCSDSLIGRRIEQLKRSKLPLVYTPGDNEWTDCHRDSNGNYQPLERLAYIRKLAFSEPKTLGEQGFAVSDQSTDGFPEHQMWLTAGTLFVTLNVPGSNNNLYRPSSRQDSDDAVMEEFSHRHKAIQAWLKRATMIANDDKSKVTEIVLMIQGNPIDGTGTAWSISGLWQESNGYARFLALLANLINETQKPTLLIHGDTHRFKWDQPDLIGLTKKAKEKQLFYRLEGWGFPVVNQYIRLNISSGGVRPFNASPVTIPSTGYTP